MLKKYSRTHWEMIDGIFNLNLLVLLVIFGKSPPTTPPLAKKARLVGGYYPPTLNFDYPPTLNFDYPPTKNTLWETLHFKPITSPGGKPWKLSYSCSFKMAK